MPVPTVAIETWNPAVPAAELIVTVQAVADPGAMLLGLHMKPVSDCPKARALREDRNNAVEARRRDIFITFESPGLVKKHRCGALRKSGVPEVLHRIGLSTNKYNRAIVFALKNTCQRIFLCERAHYPKLVNCGTLQTKVLKNLNLPVEINPTRTLSECGSGRAPRVLPTFRTALSGKH
jgi:hypothetical protein